MTLFSKWAILLTSLMAVAVATAGISARAPASPPSKQHAPQSGYVGAETCVGCHENYDTTVTPTKHGFKANERTPMAQRGCESCHGPGEAHAGDPEKVKPIQFPKVAANVANGHARVATTRRARALGRQPERKQERSASTATACTRAKGRR